MQKLAEAAPAARAEAAPPLTAEQHLALVEATRKDAAPLTPAAPAAAPAVLPEPAEALPTNAVPDRPLDRSNIVARAVVTSAS